MGNAYGRFCVSSLASCDARQQASSLAEIEKAEPELSLVLGHDAFGEREACVEYVCSRSYSSIHGKCWFIA